jgi:hypothetical protein
MCDKTNRSGDNFHRKDSLLLTIPEKRDIPGHTGLAREASGLARKQRGRGGNGRELCCGFLGK